MNTEISKTTDIEKRFKEAFISYGRRESLGFVGRLHQQLKLADYDVWFDKVNIPDGDDYVQRINHGIETAHNFIYVMASRCMTSPNCLIELEYARLLGKRVIPINHQKIGKAPAKDLLASGKQALISFYKHHNLPDQNIQTEQDVLNRSRDLIGKSDWLAGQEKLSDENCQRLADWAKQYENNWVSHDDAGYLSKVLLPVFGEAIDTFDGVVRQIKAALERQKDDVHHHTQILAQALHWQKKQKATQHLLVGKERTELEEWLLTDSSSSEQSSCQFPPLVYEFICEARKNAENRMTDVFVCYDAEHDKVIRDRMVQSLSRHVKTTWIHDRDIQKGADYGREINLGIEQADNFFYLISPHSIASDYCQKELTHALKYNKRIVPLLITPTPESEIPKILRDLQYVNFTDVDQTHYDHNIDDVLNILRRDHEYYEQHKVFLARALKWQAEEQKPSFLLRGHNLDNAKTWLRLKEKREEHPPLPLHKELINASEAAKGQLGTEVFISYSRKDSDFARHLNTKLQEAGKTTYFDQESISKGVDFEKELFKGIEGADNFVFVISPDAVESSYCQGEVEYAAEQSKRFISVLHRETEPTSMPKTLQKINWIDFLDESFDQSFSELIQAIELDRVHAHQHTVLQQRASDWTENNRSDDFLLNITACGNAEGWRDRAQEEEKKPVPTALQQNFIQDSRKAIKKANRRRNMLFSVVGVSAIVAVVLAGFSLQQAKKAKSAETKAKKQTQIAEEKTKEVLKKSSLTKDEAKTVAEQFIAEEGGRIFHDSLKDGSKGPEMIWLSKGQFQMGDIYDQGSENERPVHEVSIERFAIGRYEVTVGEFQRFVEASQYQTDAEKEHNCRVYKEGGWQTVEDANWRDPHFPQTDNNQPVVCVSWNDAVAYTQWLSEQTGQTYRLPSEAEWEYAARAGREMPYWWGTRIGKDWSVCSNCDSKWDNQQTSPVNFLIPNPFGLYHVNGNVEEWVADSWHNNYQNAPNDNRVWEENGERCLRVSRGGAWQSDSSHVRLASRKFGGLLDPHSANNKGFRLTRLEEPLTQAETKQQDEAKLQQCRKKVFQDTLKNGSKGPEMVQIPAGTFKMGDIQGTGYDYEKPVHEVIFQEHFAIGRYEVTFAEYDKFAEIMGKEKPDDKGWGRGNRPVINVSWHDAMAYAKWLSEQTDEQYEYDLPSEAEWEYAARGGTETSYWWGNKMGKNQGNCSGSGDNFKYTSPVGSFSANPFGLYDTAGNVWEWIADSWHADYTNAPNDGRVWTEGADGHYRVLRGGSWFSNSSYIRTAYRSRLDPGSRNDYIGFRVVRRVVART